MRWLRLLARASRAALRPAVALGVGATAAATRMRVRAEEKEQTLQQVSEQSQETPEAEEDAKAQEETAEEETVEQQQPGVDVCAEEDLQEGQMKEFIVGPDVEKDKIIVARVDGKLFAVSAFCTHFNFQLSKGLLLGERLFCPLHLACFSVKTGLNEFGPTLKPLSVHGVSVRDGRVLVHLSAAERSSSRAAARRDPHDKRHFLIVGGGPAGLAAAETLRTSGFTGQLSVVAAEEGLPFDRTSISKNLQATPEKTELRSRAYIQERDIDWVPGLVTQIDDRAGTALLSDGNKIAFDKVLLATGGTARNPLGEHALTLRTHADLAALRERVDSTKNIVIVGSSYIAVEAAAMLRDAYKDAQITLVARKGLYGGRLTPEATNVMRGLVAKAGIAVREGEVRAVSSDRVLLASGESLSADVIVAGVGIEPNGQALRSDLRAEDGGCRVDRFLQASEKIFAAGDVASVEGVRIEHYSEAIEQGMVAAWNMLGKRRRHAFVPFFWTRAFNQSVASVGLAPANAKVILQGDTVKPSFVEFQCDETHCPALKGVNAGENVILFAQALRMGRRVTPGEAAQPDFFEKLKEEIRANPRLCRCVRQEVSR